MPIKIRDNSTREPHRRTISDQLHLVVGTELHITQTYDKLSPDLPRKSESYLNNNHGI